MSKTSDTMRKEWKVNDARRDAGLTTPDDIQRFDNLLYGSDPVWNILDVYRPREKQGKLPVIVNIHGGGWVYGDKDLYQFYGMTLAQRGFAVVNFTYRLAPEAKYPAPLEDTNDVIGWRTNPVSCISRGYTSDIQFSRSLPVILFLMKRRNKNGVNTIGFMNDLCRIFRIRNGCIFCQGCQHDFRVSRADIRQIGCLSRLFQLRMEDWDRDSYQH